ncbi:cysteine hydrolase [Rhodocytophaga rosea]|uniref:Cysteine hydrolase n=1 Tax=Rhodocytophaga rosea TaxID=2704465 RepID=A0A6C0GHX8_9BACT|nr:isochorismatase family cysteine hydrolase [Rhodocytophaga rosea]QHT67292.1 cysteine hydrolase [Rhodocytophaga rosea]
MATPVKNHDLHGNVPDSSPAVLLLIDLINDFEFVDGDKIYNHLLPQVDAIVNLKQKAKKAGIPVIYVNDNFGKWQSDFRKLLDHCLQEGVKSKAIIEKLKPDEEDYFVLKPKHSAFYSTTLDVLLDYLKAKTLIMAGITGNICVLFTANDAFMRDFSLIIPSDCVASENKKENTYALEQMRKLLKADTRPSTKIDFKKYKPVKK